MSLEDDKKFLYAKFPQDSDRIDELLKMDELKRIELAYEVLRTGDGKKYKPGTLGGVSRRTFCLRIITTEKSQPKKQAAPVSKKPTVENTGK